MSIYRRLAMALVTFWILISFIGCIAVSREVRREVTPEAAMGVIDGGQWELEQEWVCTASQSFDLDLERRDFDRSRDAWIERGWEMTDISVVPLPATVDDSERICLVGSYRRWVEADS